jgi:actin-like ATPase involved in cell morphogenesis
MEGEMAHSYRLGVDLGTTYTAAAIGRDGRAEMCTLGERAASIPSVVLVRQDGEVLVGDAAQRRSVTEPTRVAREFKRRLGDTAPLILGGVPYTPEVLMAHVLRHVVRQVSTLEDRPPDEVVLTHPANFGPYKLDLMREVARQADVSNVRLLAEPQAAALAYAQRASIEPGTTVAVYDFGGGTFDVALVRRDGDGSFRLVGSPEGMDRLGGIDFDQAIMARVVADVGLSDRLADADPTVLSALADLRDRCREAKEALSTDVDAAIAVNLPGVQTNVRLNRAEFEDLIRPRIVETVESLQRVIRNSGMASTDIDRVLLVGGSSRIPMVAESVRSITGRPVALDANPKNAICQGAALFDVAPAAPPAKANPAPVAAVTPPPPPPPSSVVPPSTVVAPPPPPLPTTTAPTMPPTVPLPATAPSVSSVPEPARKAGRNNKVLIGAAAAAAVLIGAIAVLATRGGDDPKVADTTAPAVDTTLPVTEPSSSPSSEPVTSEPTPTATAPAITEPIVLTGPEGRSTVYGPVRYTIDSVQASNTSPPFDPTSTFFDAWHLRFNVSIENLIDSEATSSFIDFVLVLGDGTQVQGSYAEESFLAAKSTGRSTLDFRLGDEQPTDDIFEGATLLMFGSGLSRGGIVLSGDEVVEQPSDTVALTDAAFTFVDANATIERRATGVRTTLNNVEVAPFAGTYEARGVRAAEGRVWLLVDITTTCVADAGGGCFLADGSIRLSADGNIAGVTDIRYEVDQVLIAGTSVQGTAFFEVEPATAYQLIIGFADGENQAFDLPITDQVSQLVDSAAPFNP